MIKKISQLFKKSRTSKTVSASSFFVDTPKNDQNKVIMRAIDKSTAAQREILNKHNKRFAKVSN